MLKKHKRNGGNPRIRKKCFSLGVYKFKRSQYRNTKASSYQKYFISLKFCHRIYSSKIIIYIIFIAKYLHSKHWLVKECYPTFFNTLFTIG